MQLYARFCVRRLHLKLQRKLQGKYSEFTKELLRKPFKEN